MLVLYLTFVGLPLPLFCTLHVRPHYIKLLICLDINYNVEYITELFKKYWGETAFKKTLAA